MNYNFNFKFNLMKLSSDEEDSNEQDKNEIIRDIQIDYKMAAKQVKLNILGIEIFFPYKPYDNQILYMKKMIETFQKKGIGGLESPTGTGKTLCLLCASLAYLKHLREELIKSKKLKNENGINDNDKKIQPMIYYTSRTHAQITNVIMELRKTVYRPINAVISSREQSCVNDLINNQSNGIINLKCKYAKKRGECKYFRGKAKKVGGWSAYDGLTVDELKKKGKTHIFCPYFFEKEKSKNSDIVFLPYNYIFDMKIFSRSNLNLKNSILIIDEAHNLQDICCDSASIDINTNVLDEIVKDLKSLQIYFEDCEKFGKRDTNSGNISTSSLKNEILILNILKERIMNFKLENRNVKSGQNPGLKLDPKSFFDLLFKSYKGTQTTISLFNIGKTNQSNTSENNIFLESKNNQEENESEKNDDISPELTPKNIVNHISFLKEVDYYINNERGKGTLLSIYIDFLEIIKLLSINYYDQNANKVPLNIFVNSFRFYIEEEQEINRESNNKKNKKFSFSSPKVIRRILHIYCFNPGVGFKTVMDQQFYSTIITSGTLSPIDSMESELKQNFDYKLENTHVIDDSQFNFCVLTSSPLNDIEFNFNIDNRFNIEMIYQLGLTILELCKITPGGILIFFSSYNIMDKYVYEWTEKKIISEISEYKEFFRDRRDSRENKKVLEKYQLAITQKFKKTGALLLSVCRGSCSEGMNFKDDMARLVIVIGIPYAMLYDPKVQLKKEFQDEFNKLLYKDEKYKGIKKLSGSEWYSQNAIKCVNQSLGRVIRHSNDYGSMILIDTRYQYIVRKNYISLWMRNKCKIYYKNNNKSFFNDTKNFYKNVKDFIKNKKLNEEKKQLVESSDNNSTNSKNKKISKTQKSSKLLYENMNKIENSIKDSNKGKFIIYGSKKIKINEIKIGVENNNSKREIKNENTPQNDLEGIDAIDESFFDNLSEIKDNEKMDNEEINENETSNKKLIEEFIKKKEDKKFIEELEKQGFVLKQNNEEKEEERKVTCPICYESVDYIINKIEVGKCGHQICQKCWKRLEDSEGNAKCPTCRKMVKRAERNIVYIG